MREQQPMNLSMTCTLGTPIIPSSDRPRLVYGLVDIECAGVRSRAPGYVILLLDCSESMRIRLVTEEQFRWLANTGSLVEVMTDGIPAWQVKDISPELMAQLRSRMEFVLQAMGRFSEQIGEQDFYSVVAFASEGLLLAPATPGWDRKPLQKAIDRLESLSLGNETCLADGLRMALDQASGLEKPGFARRIVLLTDGYTGDVASVYALADQARRSRVPVTTIGVGAEFNEGLLIPLADRTGGNAYYIDRPEMLPQIFAREAETALSILFSNLDLQIRLPAGVSMRRVSRITPDISRLDPSKDPEGLLSLYLGDYPQGRHIELLVELVIERPAPAQNRPLAWLSLGFDDPQRSGPQRVQASVTVSMVPGVVDQMDAQVARAVQKATAFQIGSRALEEAPNLPPAEAANRLRQAAARLAELGEQRLAEQMNQQARDLERQGKMDARATKKLIYETRRLRETDERPGAGK